MAKLLLLNPKPRKRKKARTAKQKAATKKLVAANRTRFAAKRRSNPKPRKTIKRKTTMAKRRKPYRMTAGRRRAIAKLKAYNRSRRKTNPVRKRRVTRKAVARRANPVRRRTYRKRRGSIVRRRNPISRAGIQRTVIDAFQASLGAIALDFIWGYAPVPGNWKTGQFRHLVKGVGAIGMGMIAEMVVSKPQAAKMVHGAMTVTLHDAIKEFIATNVPQVQLGYYSPAMTTNGMGMYMGGGSDRLSGLGHSDRLAGMGAYVGGSLTSPYLSPTNLSEPFRGPSAAEIAMDHCPTESEGNMNGWY